MWQLGDSKESSDDEPTINQLADFHPSLRYDVKLVQNKQNIDTKLNEQNKWLNFSVMRTGFERENSLQREDVGLDNKPGSGCTANEEYRSETTA